ncbi:MAG TPA: helix-turn-helix domain-containing protein [Paucimonas sp.]|nr:helix-turn-helix domain-containing protein [Paucimonas sp.]
MALLDLLGRRWSMRVLWEINNAPCSFRDLQGICGKISSSVLNTRLHELREAGLVELSAHGYHLTPLGKELMVLIAPLRKWSEKWRNELGTRT